MRKLTILISALVISALGLEASAAGPRGRVDPVRARLGKLGAKVKRLNGGARFTARLALRHFLDAAPAKLQLRGNTLHDTRSGNSVSLTANKLTFRSEHRGFTTRATIQDHGKGVVIYTDFTRGAGQHETQRTLSYRDLDVDLRARPRRAQIVRFQQELRARGLLRRLSDSTNKAREAEAVASALRAAGIPFGRINYRYSTVREAD